MFSEIATEDTIRAFVSEIKKKIEENTDNPVACSAFKEIGRFALTQFEWSAPAWADEYRELFEETKFPR